MSMPECKLSQECIREIKLEINTWLFTAGMISSDMYRQAQERIVKEG